MKPVFNPARLSRLFSLLFLSASLVGNPAQAGQPEAGGGSIEVRSFADTLLQRGEFFRARMEYERFLFLYPDDPAVPEVRASLATAAQVAEGDSSLPAQRGEEKTPLGFADYLFEGGHYYQAVTEYERFIYYYPDHPSVSRARLKIALCYKLGGQYDRAIELFQALADEFDGNEIGTEAAFNTGDCLRLREDYDRALTIFNTLIEGHPQHPLADRARYYSAWAYIQLEDYAAAKGSLTSIKNSYFRKSAEELARGLEELPNLPRKSPLLAGLLAVVIPGAGHLYTGEKKQALFSLITNALFTYGTYEAFSSELYVAGGFLSLLSMNYYGGNIFGALNSAHKYNRRVKESYLDRYRQHYDLSLRLRGRTGVAFLQFAFHY